MKTWLGLLGMLLLCFAAVADDAVVELSKHLGKTPALVVVVCGGDERDLPTIAGLVEQTPWTVFCRGPASRAMDKIRDWASEKGLLGGRVCVVDDSGASLWLAGDMADAVWVAPGVAPPPSEKEMLRVLHPGGVCVASGKVVVKPAQSGVDEWRHPYHGPDNNVVSQDRVARLPGELRFQTYPVFAAMPNQTLFAGGRIFFFSGHIAFHEREEPLSEHADGTERVQRPATLEPPARPELRRPQCRRSWRPASEVVFAEGGTLWMLDAATGQERGKFGVPARSGRGRRHGLEMDCAGEGHALGGIGPAGRPRRASPAEKADGPLALGRGRRAVQEHRRQFRCGAEDWRPFSIPR